MRPSPLDLPRAILTFPVAATDALASLPRLARALEQISARDGPVATLSRGGGALDRLADVSTTLERLATLDQSLAKLGELGPTLQRIGDLTESVKQIAELEESLVKLSQLATTMDDLQASVATLATAVAPLQGATERIGRMVDRIPNRRGRIAAPPPPRKLPPPSNDRSANA